MNLYRQIEIDVRKNIIKPLVAGVFTVALLALPPQAPERSQIRFENHQKLSRVDFILNNSTTDDKPVIDAVLGGEALLDFDNDGFPDIYVTGVNRNTLYQNIRHATFTAVTACTGLFGISRRGNTFCP